MAFAERKLKEDNAADHFVIFTDKTNTSRDDFPQDTLESLAQGTYEKSYDELTDKEKAEIDVRLEKEWEDVVGERVPRDELTTTFQKILDDDPYADIRVMSMTQGEFYGYDISPTKAKTYLKEYEDKM